MTIMTTKLTVYWNEAPSEAVRSGVEKNTLEDFVMTGKSNRVVSTNPSPQPESGPYSVVREFASAQDAQDWLDQVLLFRATPANYTIEPLNDAPVDTE